MGSPDPGFPTYEDADAKTVDKDSNWKVWHKRIWAKQGYAWPVLETKKYIKTAGMAPREVQRAMQ